MKKYFSVILFLFYAITSNAQLNFLNSQEHFVYSYSSYYEEVANMYCDTSVINPYGSKLDILQCVYTRDGYQNSGMLHSDATYRFNIGSTNFEINGTNIFYTQGSSINSVKGVQFIKLNTGSPRNDAVIWRDQGFYVYTNTTNSGIGTTANQNISDEYFSFQYMSKGSFVNDYSLNQYNLIDLITYGYDTQDNYDYFRIYKNLGNGNFNSNPISINMNTQSHNTLTKMISAQIDFPISPYAEYYYPNQINKSDIIVLNNNTIYIYLNNNNNAISTTPTTTITKNYTISDFTVCDINNDGYNELIIAGVGGTIEVHNNSHYTFYGTASFNFTNSTLFSQYLTTGDFDRDGWNDLVVGHGNSKSIYRNQYSTSPSTLFSSSACQTIADGSVWATKLIVADLHNLGGLSLLVTGLGAIMENGNEDPPSMCEGQFRYNPSTQYSDPAPAPPITFWSYYEDGTTYRPKVLLNNHGEKDFQNYQVWKFKTGWSNWQLIASDVTNSYYIDYTEWINNEDGGDIIIPNCFYKATCKDDNDNVSGYSEQIEYIVGDNGCLFCGEGDNTKNNKNTNNVIPSKYSVSNYPNPFNPVTKIKYELPNEGKVSIVIFDMLGREVKTLVNNELKQAGSYIVEFNGSHLASGIYFYKMQVGNFVQVKRMILIK